MTTDALRESGMSMTELCTSIIVGAGFVILEVMCDMVYNLSVLIPPR